MRESVKKALLAIPAGAGAMILAAIAVSPDVARSNLEKWAEVVGVWIPSWVTDTRTAVTAVVLIFLFYLWLFRKRIPFELRRKSIDRTNDETLPAPTLLSPTMQDQIGQYFLNKAIAHDRYLEHEKENQERKVELYAASLEGVTVTGDPSVQKWGNPDASVRQDDTLPPPITGEGSVAIELATSGNAMVSGGGRVTASGEKSSEEARPSGTAKMIRAMLTDIQGGSERVSRRYDAALKAIQEIGFLLSNQTLTPEEKNTKAEQILIDFWDKAITITGHEPTVISSSYAGFPTVDGVVQFPDEIPPSQSDAKAPSEPDSEG